MITVDGTSYNVPIESLKIKGEFLDKYAERTQDGVLHRELIGVYFNYELKMGRPSTNAIFSAFWQKLSEPTEFHTIVLPDDDGDFTFSAYVSGLSAELLKDYGSSNKKWKNLTVNFIAKSPARTP